VVASFIHMPLMLVLHESKYINTVKRTLFDLVLFHVAVFLVIAMYA